MTILKILMLFPRVFPHRMHLVCIAAARATSFCTGQELLVITPALCQHCSAGGKKKKTKCVSSLVKEKKLVY